jgi:hypothetical protein
MLVDAIDPRIAAAVGGAFGSAASAVGEKMERSAAREERGERAYREDTITEEFLDQFGDALTEAFAGIRDPLAAIGAGVGITYEAVNLPVADETVVGADIGIRVRIRTSRSNITKALLVQCKRAHLKGLGYVYDALYDDGPKQARDMLRITPASFFFLFNHVTPATTRYVNGHLTPLSAGWLIYTAIAGLDALADPSVTVMPAAQVEAVSRTGARLPRQAHEVLPGTAPLGYFMSAMFTTCFVGDPRPAVVRVATPPAQRDAVAPLPDDDDGHFEHIFVRRSLALDLDFRGVTEE